MGHVNGILIIGNWRSTSCDVCGRSADPTEPSHQRVPQLYTYREEVEGCGVIWSHVTSKHAGEDFEKAARRLRPDLEWIGPWEYHFGDKQ